MRHPPLLLLTRPTEASASFAADWTHRMGSKARVLIAPIFAITAVSHQAPHGTAIFTSAHAPPLVKQKGRPAHAWCVGARTAEAASKAGYHPKTAHGSAQDLIEKIVLSDDPGPFVHFRGRETRQNITQSLRQTGRTCDEVIVYSQDSLPLSTQARIALENPGTLLLPLFSPRSAERLSTALNPLTIRAHLKFATLSPAVLAAWSGPNPQEFSIAKRPDRTAMLEALETLASTG